MDQTKPWFQPACLKLQINAHSYQTYCIVWSLLYIYFVSKKIPLYIFMTKTQPKEQTKNQNKQTNKTPPNLFSSLWETNI